MSDLPTRITKKTLVDDIVSQLFHLLESGELKLGDQLPPITELAQAFSVSRNSMREALSVLTATGYLTSQAGSGTFISRPESQDGAHFFSVLLAQNVFTREELSEVLRLLEQDTLAGNRAAVQMQQLCQAVLSTGK